MSINQHYKSKLEKKYQELEKNAYDSGIADPLFGLILQPLFEYDGYQITHSSYWWEKTDDIPEIPIELMEDCGFIAQKGQERVCVEFKGVLPDPKFVVKDIVDWRMESYLNHVDRVMITVARRCEHWEQYDADQIDSRIQIIDFRRILEWIQSIEISPDDSEFRMLLNWVTDRLARLIARNPIQLWTLEWRDLERMLATVFEGLGFEVELTPPAKDGGKDIILSCYVHGQAMSYIVEIKHWRSSRVGSTIAQEFLNVIIRENHDAGLLLASSGFSENCKESLVEIEKQRLRLGDEEKIVSLCKAYVREDGHVWNLDCSMSDLLFADTV